MRITAWQRKLYMHVYRATIYIHKSLQVLSYNIMIHALQLHPNHYNSLRTTNVSTTYFECKYGGLRLNPSTTYKSSGKGVLKMANKWRPQDGKSTAT